MDNLESRRLGVAANTGCLGGEGTSQRDGSPVVHFRMYSNYAAFLKRAEIRIFEQQSFQAEPLAIIPVDDRALQNGIRREKFSRAQHANSSTCFALMTRRAISMKRMRGRCGLPPAIGWKIRDVRQAVTSGAVAAYGESDLARQQEFRWAADGEGAGQRHTGGPQGLGSRPRGSG